MARSKSTKNATKRQNVKDSLGHYQRIEKEFLGIPGKFAGQLKKDISTQRQKEVKLKAAWNKNKSQLKNAETRLKTASKNKMTSAGKKQFNQFKKTHTTVLQNQTSLQKQIAEITNVIQALTSKHAKLVALNKHISQFNRDWKGPTKTTATRTKRKPKTVKPTTTQQERPFETTETTYRDTTKVPETEVSS